MCRENMLRWIAVAGWAVAFLRGKRRRKASQAQASGPEIILLTISPPKPQGEATKLKIAISQVSG
jgi:hypothetical protein